MNTSATLVGKTYFRIRYFLLIFLVTSDWALNKTRNQLAFHSWSSFTMENNSGISKYGMKALLFDHYFLWYVSNLFSKLQILIVYESACHNFLLGPNLSSPSIKLVDQVRNKGNCILEGSLLVSFEIQTWKCIEIEIQPNHLLISGLFSKVSPSRSELLLGREGSRGKSRSSMLRLIIVFLMLDMQDHQFIFCLLELASQAGNLLLVWLLIFL
jgi:hypothetical protein